MKKQGFNTKCIHSGARVDPEYQGLNTPIHTSSSYKIDLDLKSKIPYPRYHNTLNSESVAAKLAVLENAEHAYVLGSGMAAISTALLSCLEKGDHLLVQKEIYGGTYNFVENVLASFGIEYSWFAVDELSKLETLLKPNTRAVYIETPSNPLLKIVDLKFVAGVARKHNLVSMIDNTFATPINQRPIEYGIDIVCHSGSKYFGGHSDLLCGAVMTSSDTHARRILARIKNFGGVLDAHSCYLLERSLKTLALRVERQNYNAGKIAEYLKQHAQVKQVNYPGLKSFSGYKIACKQMDGFGGMMSFELDAELDATKKFLMSLKIITPAVSLGGVESIITMPRISSHSHMTAEERKAAGVSDSLVRFSVGVEDLDDLLEDLEQAFKNS